MIKQNLPVVQGLLLLVILWNCSSCASTQVGKQQVLKHVVSLQFKDEVPEEKRAEAIRIFRELKDEIPEIKKFEGGKNISGTGANQRFTHCFVLTFDSEAARDIYLPHPAHMAVVEKNKPLFSDLLVVDYWAEE